jgi:hypothetical protein
MFGGAKLSVDPIVGGNAPHKVIDHRGDCRLPAQPIIERFFRHHVSAGRLHGVTTGDRGRHS